ncbi:hypothetical protein C8J57DRAFT_1504538 [Mycena rebaudengoi]|nr:hypothetical protein C8J57DRAFT_1504538 [Mycena rebaudengoi]
MTHAFATHGHGGYNRDLKASVPLCSVVDTLKPTPPARVISFRRCLLASGILTSPLECFIAGHIAPAAAVSHGYLHLHLAESKEQAMASVAAVFVH